jgi:hypothetical protein
MRERFSHRLKEVHGSRGEMRDHHRDMREHRGDDGTRRGGDRRGRI